MSEDKEWGPWIDHDGRGCPCKGVLVRTVDGCGVEREHIAHGLLLNPGSRVTDMWLWHPMPPELRPYRVVRYRMKRPKALQSMIEMIENLPAPVKEREYV